MTKRNKTRPAPIATLTPRSTGGQASAHRVIPAGSFVLLQPAQLKWLQGSTDPVRVKIPEKNSFHPNRRATAQELSKTQPPADVSAFVTRMSASLEKHLATTKENEPAELRRKIARLERQLRETPTAPAPEPEIRIERVPILNGEVKHLETAVSQMLALSAQLAGASQSVAGAAHEISAALRVAVQAFARTRTFSEKKWSTGERPAAPRGPMPIKTAPAAPRALRAAPIYDSDSISRKQKSILNALAWLEAVGLAPVDKTQLALLAGASPTSSTYTNNLGQLRTAGLIDYPQPGTAALTDLGRAQADAPATPPTTADLQREILERLRGKRADLLRALIAVYPESLSKGELAERAGASPTSSAYTNNLGALRSLGLVEYPAPGRVAALPVLFID